MSSPAQTQHGLKDVATLGFIHFAHLGEDDGGGQPNCFHSDILTKTGTERERTRAPRIFSPDSFGSASFIIYRFDLFWAFGPSCVCWRPRDVCRSAVRRRGFGPVRQHSGRRFLLRWQVLGRTSGIPSPLQPSALTNVPLGTWIRHNSGYSSRFLNSYWTSWSVYQ